MSIHQKSIGPSLAYVEAYSSVLSIYCDNGGQGEYDQQRFACHKHFQGEDRDEGGTDAKNGKETFDDSKDSSQALWVHLLKDRDTNKHDSEEEDDKWE